MTLMASGLGGFDLYTEIKERLLPNYIVFYLVFNIWKKSKHKDYFFTV